MIEITAEIRAFIDKAAAGVELAEDEYIDPSDGLIHCKKCGGQRQTVVPCFGKSGYFMPRCICQCQREAEEQRKAAEERQRRMERIKRRKAQGLQDRYLYDYTFSNDNGQNPLMDKAHAYVENWKEAYKSNIGLLLFGDVGTGKSFFAGCIANTPYVLEFAGLEDKASYHESDLESAVIGKMQKFLLELGKGFLFEQRQKRFTFNDKNFYVDLVLYNRLLRCYVLIDFKIDELTHQDLGQMQMYVNYYDRYEKIEGENPTIGILLCKQSDEALVDLTLPENANIYAKEYKLYLPDKKLLQKKLKEWLDEEQN